MLAVRIVLIVVGAIVLLGRRERERERDRQRQRQILPGTGRCAHACGGRGWTHPKPQAW